MQDNNDGDCCTPSNTGEIKKIKTGADIKKNNYCFLLLLILMEEEAEQKNYFKIPTCPKCCVIDRTEQKRGGVQKKRFHGNKNVFALDLLENPCVVKLMKKRQTTLMKNKREVVNFFISHKHPNIIEYLGFDDTTCDTHFWILP